MVKRVAVSAQAGVGVGVVVEGMYRTGTSGKTSEVTRVPGISGRPTGMAMRYSTVEWVR